MTEPILEVESYHPVKPEVTIVTQLRVSHKPAQWVGRPLFAARDIFDLTGRTSVIVDARWLDE